MKLPYSPNFYFLPIACRYFLFQAYLFAKENKLTKGNFLQSHTLLSKHLLPEK
jgi:hypothetical protein